MAVIISLNFTRISICHVASFVIPIEPGSSHAALHFILSFVVVVHLGVESNTHFGRDQRRQLLFLVIVFTDFVNPFQSFLSFVTCHVVVLDYLAHLGVQESVSYYHFFVLELLWKALAFKRHLVKIETQRSQSS